MVAAPDKSFKLGCKPSAASGEDVLTRSRCSFAAHIVHRQQGQ